jgi:pantetheine-phosphate adenylyltransferase
MISVYAGSFDPITLGHEWIIKNAPGDLIVVVADNALKRCLLTVEQRVDLVRKSVATIEWNWSRVSLAKNIEVAVLSDRYLVDYAKDRGASYLIRGARTVTDFEYEVGYADVCSSIGSSPPLHLLMVPPPELRAISSSVVRSLVGPPGWEDVVARYVSPHVVEALR